jgi:Xaa-Pro aminopeptidase
MVLEKSGPIALLKALKNDVELEGMRNCHIRDGVAVVNLLTWSVLENILL